MGKSTISMAIFHSFLYVHQRVSQLMGWFSWFAQFRNSYQKDPGHPMHCTSWYRKETSDCNWKKRCVTSVSLESLEGKSVHGSKMVKSLVFWCTTNTQNRPKVGMVICSIHLQFGKNVLAPEKMVGVWTNSAGTKSWFIKKKNSHTEAYPNHQRAILTSHLLLETNVQAREELEDSQGSPHGRRVLQSNQGNSRDSGDERPLGKADGNLKGSPVITGWYPLVI